MAGRRPAPWLVTDELWAWVGPLLPPRPDQTGKAGRRWLDDRRVLCGILFVLYTGIQWEYLPAELGFGSGMTCWRRVRDWNAAGRAAGELDWDRAVVDSSQVRALAGGPKRVRARPTGVGRAPSTM